MSSKLEELVGKPITEAQFDEAAGKKDACYHKVKARYDVWPSAYASGALPKDTRAIIQLMKDLNLDFEFFKTMEEDNKKIKRRVERS